MFRRVYRRLKGILWGFEEFRGGLVGFRGV